MNKKENIIRAARLLQYELFRYPKESEITFGLEYQKNLWNGLAHDSINPEVHCDSVIHTDEGKIPLLWGDFTIEEKYRNKDYFNSNDLYIFKNSLNQIFTSKLEYDKGFWWTIENQQYKCTTIPCANIEGLHEKLKAHQLRVRNPLTAEYLRPIGWKYPLHFIYWENNKCYHIVLMPPKEGSVSRDIYLNGKLLKEQKRPSIMYSNDWHYLRTTPTEIERGGKALKLQQSNDIYKYLVGIPLTNYHGKLKIIPIKTEELRKKLKKDTLRFSYKNLDIVVSPKRFPPFKCQRYDYNPETKKLEKKIFLTYPQGAYNQYEVPEHEIYVNGKSQRTIAFYEPMYFEWYYQKDQEFLRDFRYLLKMDWPEKEPTNVLQKYYIGKIDDLLEDYLNIWEDKPKDPVKIASDIIIHLTSKYYPWRKTQNV